MDLVENIELKTPKDLLKEIMEEIERKLLRWEEKHLSFIYKPSKDIFTRPSGAFVYEKQSLIYFDNLLQQYCKDYKLDYKTDAKKVIESFVVDYLNAVQIPFVKNCDVIELSIENLTNSKLTDCKLFDLNYEKNKEIVRYECLTDYEIILERIHKGNRRKRLVINHIRLECFGEECNEQALTAIRIKQQDLFGKTCVIPFYPTHKVDIRMRKNSYQYFIAQHIEEDNFINISTDLLPYSKIKFLIYINQF